MTIAIVCFDNFTDIDVFLPWDLLNRVRLVGGISDWDVQLFRNGKKLIYPCLAYVFP